MKIKAIAPWFGSNRMLAENVGAALEGCGWVGVPFAGGMSELVHIQARTLVVNDLHRHVVNLAFVAAHPILGPKLLRRLRRLPFHPSVLERAQEACLDNEAAHKALIQCPDSIPTEDELVNWAENYFVCAWMSRSGTAGTKKEFDAPLSLRWNAAGGDSVVRFRNAAEGLREWRAILQRATFTTLDVFDFLAKCKDEEETGIYLDPPFPGPGDGYKHAFNEAQQQSLAARLMLYREATVVCRFYDVPFIRELYPEPEWSWYAFAGRKQTNGAAPEVLLVRKLGKAA